jgi:hypothetical protein
MLAGGMLFWTQSVQNGLGCIDDSGQHDQMDDG